MPIDTNTLGTQTPETLDGRTYPEYLRVFEDYDKQFLSSVERLSEPTLNALAVEASSPQLRSAVSPWVASAEWRGLIERVDPDELAGRRRYRLTDRGKDKLGDQS